MEEMKERKKKVVQKKVGKKKKFVIKKKVKICAKFQRIVENMSRNCKIFILLTNGTVNRL